MKLLPIIASLFCISSVTMPVFAQKNKDVATSDLKNPLYTYTKLDDYKTFLDDLAKKTSDSLDKKLRKDYNEIISDKNKELITDLSEQNFLFDTTITKYLSDVFYYIVDKNGLNRNSFHFFVNRSPVVNAYTYDDGTIVCNIGILNIAETESQVAMVFCHELSHYLLNHPKNAIINSIEKFNSPEFMEKVKEIKKEKFNTKKQLEDLLMTDLFNRRRHNRSQEIAADSLGMLLFSKTNYGASTVPHLFSLLDSSENLMTKRTIQSFCKEEDFNTDEKWFITKKKMSFGTAEKKEIADTLKTHPDCAKRKIYSETFFSRNPKPGTDFFLATKAQLNYVKTQALYAEASYSKDKERLSYYLYQLIQDDAQFPSDKPIKTEIFNMLVTFCLKQKKHTLAPVIDTPYITENANDEYAKLLKLLDAIDLAKMKEMTLKYYEKNKNYITLNNELNTNFTELNKL